MNIFIAFIFCILGFLTGIALCELINEKKQELKCVQGELYEEVKPNIFVKSHLECFEQKTLVP